MGEAKRRLAFRRCDVERALRASKAVGGGSVTIAPDGTIHIERDPSPGRHLGREADKDRVIVL